MSIRSFFTGLLDDWRASASGGPDPGPSVNPATGLPMMDGAVDVAGDPFGTAPHSGDHSAGWSGSGDHHHRSSLDDHRSGSAGSAGSIGTGGDSSSSSSTSDPWSDHSSTSGGYDPSRGW